VGKLKNVLILAGGGGHTSIALAIAQALMGKTENFFLIPRDDKLSRELLTPYGSVYELIKARYPSTSNLYFPIRFLSSIYYSLSKVKGDYSVVVSTGSNFCIPPAVVAWLKSVPIVNIESRVALTKPSKTARILQHFSKKTLLQWEEQAKNLKGVVTGPIFPERRYESRDLGYILVTGGTEGHKQLFDVFVGLDLKRVVMQTGKVDPDPYRKKRPNWTIIPFSTEFEKLVAESSMVVTHQGGGTIFEAVLYEKPVIVVFNPELTRTANTEDMKMLAKKVDAPFLERADAKKIEFLIAEATERRKPHFENGRIRAAEIILGILEGTTP
jgi:UDP-N-acetylglucosamine--N-acetylmuramyl-(pentapeptide) pyrophosphoryl-undecaprenol N-acetylglucosamine transferase